MTAVTTEERARLIFSRVYGAAANLTRLPGVNNAVYRGEFSGQTRILKLVRPEKRAYLKRELHVVRELARRSIPVVTVEHCVLDDPDVWPFAIMLDAGRTTLADFAQERSPRTVSAFENMGRLLAEIHQFSDAGTFAKWVPVRTDADYQLESQQIRAWARESGFLAEASLASVDTLVDAVPDLAANHLCHNDFHALHCVTDNSRLTALIDWEEATLGNRVVDVAITQTNLDQYVCAENSQAFTDGYFTHSSIARSDVQVATVLSAIRILQSIALGRVWHARRKTAAVESARKTAMRELERYN